MSADQPNTNDHFTFIIVQSKFLTESLNLVTERSILGNFAHFKGILSANCQLPFLGRQLGAPVDVVLGNPSVEPRSRNDYAAHVVDMMTDAYEQVRVHLGRAAETAKRYYDTKATPVTFEIGDKVWVFSSRG